MRNHTIRGCLVISMLFIACVSATSKDVQRKPVDVQTEIPNIENKGQSPAEPPIIVNVSPPQKTHEEIEQEAKERAERSDLDRRIVDLTRDLANLTGNVAKYTFGLFVTAVALVLATIGLGIFSWRQSRDMKDAIAVAKETASAAMLQARAAVSVELPKIILSRVDLGDTAATSLGGPGFTGIGTRVSAISCFEVSSRQTTGKSGSCGRVYTSSTSSMAATKAALASGGITHCSWR